jgi:CHAP domain-containing protein
MGWNDNPPRGGPMVKVDGFPGPLYPPDHPDGPSPDSPFVLALKRTAARIGAWPWDPDGWDDSYSNRFAHGDGWGDQDHAGIEGLQHWSGTLDATGNLGEKTFNFLRSVKVPQGRTHAGEMAMDSVCVNQINAAFDDQQPSVPAGPAREAALERAVGQLGTKESPPESNVVRYTDWYGMVGPWCAMFVTWCYDASGGPGSPSFDRNQARYSYVPYIVSDARGGRYGLSVTGTPKAGDLVCYDWQRNGEYDHVGFFEQWTGSHTFAAIEGNTSTSNDSNGGEVMRRQRDVNGQATTFVRVAEP